MNCMNNTSCAGTRIFDKQLDTWVLFMPLTKLFSSQKNQNELDYPDELWLLIGSKFLKPLKWTLLNVIIHYLHSNWIIQIFYNVE